ncbi:hypothetical protein [uncultured Dubosiella sp.]|nr:hypothetical protein [uncultured Dubosiella sp.]
MKIPFGSTLSPYKFILLGGGKNENHESFNLYIPFCDCAFLEYESRKPSASRHDILAWRSIHFCWNRKISYEVFEMISDAKKRADAKYKKATLIQKKIDLNRNTDQDLIEWLDGKVFSAYVKQLIRDDIARHKEAQQ